MNAPDNMRDLPPDEGSLRAPPHSVETEQSVLGSLLIDNDAYDRIGELRAECFYRYDHRLIFQHIGRLIAANRPADVITVFESLSSEGKAADIGGLAYLNALQANVASSTNIVRYVEIVVERWRLRGLASIADEIASDAFAPNGKTAEDLIDQSRSKLDRLADVRENEPLQLRDLLPSIVDAIDQQYHGTAPKRLTATGFIDLDELVGGGLEPGDLVIVAGRPSMGKSAFSMNIAEHIAIANGLPVAVFSLEMPAEQLAKRTIAAVGRMALAHVRDGSKMTDGDWPALTRAMQIASDAPIFIDDTPSVTLGHIRARAKMLKRRNGKLGLVVVDYLQLMGASEGENRTQQIGVNTRGLKSLGKELGCPILLLSQLNRQLENRPNKRPVMSDLRESGDIEQDADIIIFLYRDQVYHEDTHDRGIAEIIVGKQRNGALGKVGLAFIEHETRFENLAKGQRFGLGPVKSKGNRGFDE